MCSNYLFNFIPFTNNSGYLLIVFEYQKQLWFFYNCVREHGSACCNLKGQACSGLFKSQLHMIGLMCEDSFSVQNLVNKDQANYIQMVWTSQPISDIYIFIKPASGSQQFFLAQDQNVRKG